MKGISPVVAIVIVIVIAVSAGSFLAGWFMQMAMSITQSDQQEIAVSVRCSPPSYAANILSVSIRMAQNRTSIRAVVQNTGYEDNMTIENAYFYNRTGNMQRADNTPVRGLDHGEIAILDFSNVSISMCPTDFESLVATTECPGVRAVFQGMPECQFT